MVEYDYHTVQDFINGNKEKYDFHFVKDYIIKNIIEVDYNLNNYYFYDVDNYFGDIYEHIIYENENDIHEKARTLIDYSGMGESSIIKTMDYKDIMEQNIKYCFKEYLLYSDILTDDEQNERDLEFDFIDSLRECYLPEQLTNIIIDCYDFDYDVSDYLLI